MFTDKEKNHIEFLVNQDIVRTEEAIKENPLLGKIMQTEESKVILEKVSKM